MAESAQNAKLKKLIQRRKDWKAWKKRNRAAKDPPRKTRAMAKKSQKPPKPPDGPSAQTAEMDRDYFIMEYLENGDLTNFLYKAVDMVNENPARRIPNRVLWSFWLCCGWPRPQPAPSP